MKLNINTLSALRKNANVTRMLDAIMHAEGTATHGYNTAFGGGRFDDLSKHPRVGKQFTQTDGKVNYSRAAGKYQFIPATWDELSDRYGFKDFGPESQDMAAIALIARAGALDDVMAGNYDKALPKLGRTWASLPSSPYAQPKRSDEFMAKALGLDASFLKGTGSSITNTGKMSIPNHPNYYVEPPELPNAPVPTRNAWNDFQEEYKMRREAQPTNQSNLWGMTRAALGTMSDRVANMQQQNREMATQMPMNAAPTFGQNLLNSFNKWQNNKNNNQITWGQ